MDENRSNVEAVAIQGDRIRAIGTSDEIARLGTDDSEVVDLQGKTVVPGLVDGHLHFARLAADNSHIVEP